MKRLLLILCSLNLCTKGMLVGEDLACNPRRTKYGVVCVCDSTYCDTVGRPSRLRKGRYYHYITGQDSPGFTRNFGSFARKAGHIDNNTIVFKVDSSVQYQEIVGIGASFTDSAGMAVNSLPEDAQTKFIESYFSRNGLEYSAGRVPIGSSDFSTHIYTYADEDDDLTNFSLTKEDYEYKIPLIQKAMNASPHDIKLIGCSFTAPTWMKTNNAYSTGYIKENSCSVWAKYHIRFLDAYAENGINFWALTGGNEVMEPYFIGGSFALGSLALAPNQRDWVKYHLGPQLRASNHSAVKFAPLDDMRPYGKFFMSRFAADQEVFETVNGVAFHWYYDWLFPPSVLDDLHQTFPEKMILYTESSANVILFGGDYVEPGSWHRGALYIYNMIENLNHWTNVYLDWNIALNTNGGPFLQLPLDGAIIINKTSGEFYKNPMFYGIGHFSKFMPPGARRIDTQSNINTTQYTENKPKIDPELLKLYLRKKVSWKSSYVEEVEDISSTTPQTVLPTFPPFPTVTVPSTVSCVATTNPDKSTTVIVFNSMDNPVNVTIEDKTVGFITTTLAAQSVNTFIYWATPKS